MNKRMAILLTLIILVPVGSIFIYYQLNKLPTGVKRYSNHEDGISILLDHEKKSPTQLAIQINSPNNEFNGSREYKDINEQTIKEYKRKRGDMLYIGYAWFFSSLNLSSYVVGSILSDIDEIKQYRYSPTDSITYIGNWEDKWTNTGNINDLIIKSGWIIFQKIESGSTSSSLGGSGETIMSISIISENGILHFYAHKESMWIS